VQVRTVVLTRSLKGLTPHHHDFNPTQMYGARFSPWILLR
jgi:hypothetical protein